MITPLNILRNQRRVFIVAMLFLCRTASYPSFLSCHHWLLSKMLCKFCTAIDFGELTGELGYRHHCCFEDLCKSSNNGCEFCTMILQAGSHNLKKFESLNDGCNTSDNHIYLGYDPFYSSEDCIYHFHVFKKLASKSGGRLTLCYIAIFVDYGIVLLLFLTSVY